MRPFVFAAIAAGLLTGSSMLASAIASAGPPAAEPEGGWQSTLERAHPLVGQIWDSSADRFIAADELRSRLSDSTYLLLGEIHDNPDHHRLQAWLIEELGGSGSAAVVMEMIRDDQAGALQDYLIGPAPSPEGIGAALDWQNSGWPDWAIYQPIAEAALAVRASLLPGSLPATSIREVGMRGLTASFDSAERERLGLGEPWPETLLADLHQELQEAHCNLLPKEALPRMAEVQQVRDAHLADAMVKAAEGGKEPVFLVAGAGHTGSERAVPWYLAARGVDAPLASVALLEVVPGAEAPQDYEYRSDHDFLWFTPRAERDDPCAELVERFGKKPLSE